MRLPTVQAVIAGRAGRRVLASAVAGTLVVAAVSACSGSSTGSRSAAPTASPVPTPTCPSVAASASPAGHATAKALRHLPPDLPIPPSVTVVDATTESGGVHVVRFTTPMSLRESVLFILARYPKAGYVLGRGDAEATEADTPFEHGPVRGLTRVGSLQPCKTMWLVATTTVHSGSGTSPELSPRPTSSATSSLPFAP